MSEDAPYSLGPARTTRTTRSHLPVNPYFKPKISVVDPHVSQGSQLNAPQNRHDHDGQAVHRKPGLVVDPYRDAKSSSQSHPPPPQQVQQVPAAVFDDPANHGFSGTSRASLLQRSYMLGQEPLEQRLRKLSLYPHKYPPVYAQNYPNPTHGGFSQQQRQSHRQHNGDVFNTEAPLLVHPQRKMSSQQQQQPIHQPQQVLLPQQQQGQPFHSSIQLQPGTHIF